ncbi:hypothetical protein K8B33_08055 [Alcanivorax sp. JB21]|uniref:hypothetical protein n=1 Tax=Alcanivorax limicola TaxID=2874102 RepID=UPI001CBB8AD4|nr:hypothetical protein [Alcanivorax limicola]MBZ2189046.1 hypothetical protein [Alcanivorax limicola]
MRQVRRLAVAVGVPGILLMSNVALAGGGDCGSPDPVIDRQDPFCGGYILPFLSPGNDSRSNLLMMMWAHHGVPASGAGTDDSEYAPSSEPPYVYHDFRMHPYARWREVQQQESDRLSAVAASIGVAPQQLAAVRERLDGYLWGLCASNGYRASADYLEALQAADMPEEDRTALAHARLNMAGLCTNRLDGISPPDVSENANAMAFSKYLRGAVYFYREQHADAADTFAGVKEVSAPWVAEAATYMQARASLNLAQQSAMEQWYFQRENADREELDRTRALFDAYLAAFPDGQYAASANGLFRRIYWLQDDQVAAGEAYAEALFSAAPEDLLELVSEVDLRYLTDQDALAPMPLPVFMMVRQMQGLRSWPTPEEPFSAENLQASYAGFSDAQALSDLVVLAWHLFSEEAYDTVIAQTDDDDFEALDLVGFSRAMYRGIALHRESRWAQAEQHWRALAQAVREEPLWATTAELGLAIALEGGGRLNVMFAPDSPVQELSYRLPAIYFTASAEVLEQVIAHSDNVVERRVARARLLREHLSRGQYQAYLAARAIPENPEDGAHWRYSREMTDDDYPCPDTLALAEQLSATPQAPRLLNCLANVIDPRRVDSPFTHRPRGHSPGAFPNQFEGSPRSAMSVYMAVIEREDAAPDDKAYALYRAINCYLRGSNRCGSEQVEQATRARWFSRLKNRHADTVWAERQKYYW